MNKKEILITLLLFPLIILLKLTLKKFEFLMVFGIIFFAILYKLISKFSEYRHIKCIFIAYKILLAIIIGIIVIVLNHILCTGNMCRSMNVDKNIEYILILGSRLDGDKIPEVLKSRIDKALEYKTQAKKAKFIVSGGSVGTNIAEAEGMKKYLVENGIAESDILIENQAQSTYENMRYSKEIIDYLGVNDDPILVVTSDFHIARSLMIAKYFDINAYGLSSPTPRKDVFNYIIREVLAFTKDFVKVNI